MTKPYDTKAPLEEAAPATLKYPNNVAPSPMNPTGEVIKSIPSGGWVSATNIAAKPQAPPPSPYEDFFRQMVSPEEAARRMVALEQNRRDFAEANKAPSIGHSGLTEAAAAELHNRVIAENTMDAAHKAASDAEVQRRGITHTIGLDGVKRPVGGFPSPPVKTSTPRSDEIFSISYENPAEHLTLPIERKSSAIPGGFETKTQPPLKGSLGDQLADRVRELNEMTYGPDDRQKVAQTTSTAGGAKSLTTDSVSSLKDRLEDLTKKIEGFDTNIERAIKELRNQQAAVAPKAVPPPFETKTYLLTPDDLKNLQHLLNDIEAEAPPMGLKDLHTHEAFHGNYTTGRTQPPVVSEYLNKHFTDLERTAFMAKKEGWLTEADGTRKCYKDGKLHCTNGPAEIRQNGTQLYYQEGRLHRENGLPAMTAAGGTQKFAVNGKYHRLGGQPAITWSKSPYRHEWWENGEIIRAQRRDGTYEWYAPGYIEREEALLHRTDGPAVVYPNGNEEYWLQGTAYRNRHDWEIALNAVNHFRMEALDEDLIDEDPIDAFDQDVEVNTSSKQVSKTKEKKMSKPTFAEIMKKNAVEAGYRVAATQATSIVKNAILAVMKNQGADDGALGSFGAFLDTEYGASMISLALGTGLNYVPVYGDDPRVQKLGEEMRINGMATFGNAIIGEAMQHVLPALTEVLNKLPAVEESNNVRLEETNNLVEALEEDEETTSKVESTTRKTMTA
jgi:hypothetical protein